MIKNNKPPMCLAEKALVRMGGVKLIHDGLNNPSQFNLPPEDISCFTRKYQAVVDGKPIQLWFTFHYDRRKSLANFEINMREPNARGREKVLLNLPEEQQTERIT